MYLGTAEACALLAAEGGGLRGGGSEYMDGCIQGGEEGVKVLNHPLGLTGEVVIYRHRCGVRFASR
jgi:hypothetical protein